ncbi:MAG: Grx4 family monothiol glutaredoxin [Gammaproteobacteria bacterium]|nr:MAG: Grx4 family monothiol glutaredoxin [Gammaproteobacteria bacterium]
MALSGETRDIIDGLLADNKVVLFMKGTPAQPQCGFSATTISTLNMMLPDYLTVNVLEHANIRDGIKEYGNWPTIPQLYVDGELIGGCDIIQDMMKSGDLGEALGVPAPEVTTPTITINEAGIEAMQNAVESNANASLHLQIGADWTHKISLDPTHGGAVQVQIGDIELHMDPWTASRADGLNLILEEELTGTRFAFDNPNAPPPVNQMTVQALKERLDSGADVLLIDVRSDDERAKASIAGARPWNTETMQRVESLPKDREIILHCHTGGRSQALADTLRRRGYTNLHNLRGGIKAWSEEIDSSVPLY